jgi:pyruvate ferredoxin oxidoreductase gamma subunit
MLSVAAFDEGLHAQAFPSFGSERSGAPVVAYCRIDDSKIRAHDPVTAPDTVIVQDPTLLHLVPVLDGLASDGQILVNTTRSFEELHLGGLLDGDDRERLITVPATDLSRERLGLPRPNTALLGGFAALTGVVSLESVQCAIRQRFAGEIGDANAEIAAAAYDHVLNTLRSPTRA